jgi:DNA repair exonuclease SbcCD ATPase subunit
MTLVGKIFTVLILVMSVLFMAFSIAVFATHKNWKELADNPDPARPGYKQKLKAKEDELRQARAEIEQIKITLGLEQAARRHALAAAETRARMAEEQRDSLAKTLAERESALNRAAEAQKLAQDRLTALESEVARIRADLKLAQQERDDSFLQVVDLTDKLNQSETTRSQLQQRNDQLVLQVADMNRVMQAHGLDVHTLVSHIPPKVEGIVVEVSEKGLVEISLGHDDGLKVGHTLDVYRGDTYLGRIIIRRTAPDRAVGQVVKELQRGQIKKGDHVTTKLS